MLHVLKQRFIYIYLQTSPDLMQETCSVHQKQPIAYYSTELDNMVSTVVVVRVWWHYVMHMRKH